MIVLLKKSKDFCITLLLAVIHEECILNGSSWVQWVLKCVWKRCYCITYRHCDKAFSLSLHHSSALYSDIFFPFQPLRWLCRRFAFFFPKLIFSYSLKNKLKCQTQVCCVWYEWGFWRSASAEHFKQWIDCVFPFSLIQTSAVFL